MVRLCVDELPAITGFDYCSPEYGFGEIEAIIVSHVSLEGEVTTYPANETDETQWDTLFTVDEVTGLATAYYIPVRGTIGDPEQTVIDTSEKRKAYPPAEYTLEARVDDLHEATYAGLRLLNSKTVRLWFIAGGYIWGGNEGINPATINTSLRIEEGHDSLHNVVVRATWKGSYLPERNTSPNFTDETS